MNQSTTTVIKNLAPLLFVSAFGLLVLPRNGNPTFSSLEWYQQAVSALFLPTLIWSIYRLKERVEPMHQSPGEI